MTNQSHRLPGGGRIDRSKPLRFVFNDRDYRGYAGDTLASALLANGVTLVARSFKYHRPRGIMTAGAEEPNALVQRGIGNRSEPNLRATQVELYDGLTATSVNCWPSLEIDLGAFTSLGSRLLPAGFYYKTFMWPRGMWRTYERVIRSMAGLGRTPEAPDPDAYDKTNAHCDVLVVGAGPAGLATALAAGRAGARVILADEQAEMGGALLAGKDTVSGLPAAEWIPAAIAELASMPEVRLLPRTTVFGYYDHNYLTLAERVSDHLVPGSYSGPRLRLWRVRAKQVVLASGAIERPLAFADNDRPGIMLASAAATYVNRYAATPGRRAVLFTNNDSAYRAGLDLLDAGVGVAAIIDARPTPEGALVAEARRRGVEILTGHVVVGAEGARRVSAVRVMALDDSGRGVTGASRDIDCDFVGMSGGWSPTLHLLSQSRGSLRFDERIVGFVPDVVAKGQRLAGAATGSFALADCLAQGFAAGRDAAALAGCAEAVGTAPSAEPPVAEGAPRALWIVPSDKPSTQIKQFVDHQDDVTVADILLAAREGYDSVELLKRYTTTGMGTDQGKTSNVNGLAVLAEATNRPVTQVGFTTFRPPYTPVTIGLFRGADRGDLLEPVRKTPLHGWHESVGAPFENVGQWRRAWYYPKPGEDMHAAVNREVKAARTGVGIVDASTLGKIDIQGPDAATLLNWVYTNAWSKLEIGRCRYGLMLGEDGMVMDDGVTTRLGENHYLMTTTTGNAARVLAWLENWLQCEWPHYRVWCTSLTEQWATVGISGPLARQLLSELSRDIDLDPKTFPFMSYREGHVADIPARVFRISFTGELTYEVNVAPSYAMALWQALMAAGEKYGITPYGTESMHVLRAEKGFIIVGQETDGTITPYDLGMDWIVSKAKKDFIGKRSLARADTMRPDRKHLVGLLTQNPSEVLPEGGQIVAELKDRPPMTMLGHVTSSYFSPNVGRSIAMALVKNGRNRMGETVHVPLADRVISARVVEPKFFDLEGKRLDG